MVKDTLENTKKIVWPEIEKYLIDPAYPTQFSIPDKFKNDVELYWKINKIYPERKGKYLRPTLVLLVAQAMGADSKNAVKTAASMQLSEEWILIHDDIEDDSDTRRDGPTLHKEHGIELAINAGDALHIIMWKMVNDVALPKISEEFYRMLMRTALGQGVEQIWTNKKTDEITDDEYFFWTDAKKSTISDSEYFFIADSKSAYYSIAGPMRLGAMVAGATEAQIDKITEFGLYLGRCFQLVDDLLDLEQDKKEGKVTLANTKGVDYTTRLASEMKDKAKGIFDRDLGFLSSEPARSQLTELIEFILERRN